MAMMALPKVLQNALLLVAVALQNALLSLLNALLECLHYLQNALLNARIVILVLLVELNALHALLNARITLLVCLHALPNAHLLSLNAFRKRHIYYPDVCYFYVLAYCICYKMIYYTLSKLCFV